METNSLTSDEHVMCAYLQSKSYDQSFKSSLQKPENLKTAKKLNKRIEEWEDILKLKEAGKK